MVRTFVGTTLIALLVAGACAREADFFGAGQAPQTKKTLAPGDQRQIVAKLRLKYQQVVADLDQQKTGATTRTAQQDIADLIDELLNQESDPPPSGNPPESDPPPSNPPPAGAKNNPPPPKSPDPAPNRPKQNAPAPNVPLESKQTQSERDRPPMNLDQIRQEKHSGHWPDNLPSRARTDINRYGQDRFMPRYEELLRAYYRNIAEARRGKDGE
jgi:hypothetical protein